MGSGRRNVVVGGMAVPPALTRWLLWQNAQANSFLDGLPDLVDSLLRRWDLVPDPTFSPRSGANALVFGVTRATDPLVLKVSIDPGQVACEETLLRWWDGAGAVRLVDASAAEGALLLERLEPSRSLAAVPLPEAAEIAGKVLRRLAVPPPDGLSLVRTTEVARDIAAAEPVVGEANLVAPGQQERVRTLAAQLSEDDPGPAGDLLVHADLHYDNVLSGRRETWLAIDPRARRGTPEIAVAELLWTRADEVGDETGFANLLAAVVRGGGLDPERARAWAVTRSLDYLRWGLTHKLTEDPPRCARVLRALS
jgi:streptomycin 6-kinase